MSPDERDGEKPCRWPARLVLTLLALAVLPTCAGAATRAVFVGVNEYRYSRQHDPSADANFHDLESAVADVVLMKRALAKATGLQFDPGPLTTSNTCDPQNDVSITLTDACATRSAILTAFSRQVGASKAGDLVLFYYAGLSSRYAGSPPWDHELKTLTPVDARRGAAATGDIALSEIDGYVRQALARGVSVNMIIDSCSPISASLPDPRQRATSRAAPAISAMPPLTAPPSLPPTAAPGRYAYRIGIMAGCDFGQGSELELGPITRHGVLTQDLSDELRFRGRDAAFLTAAGPQTERHWAARVRDSVTLIIDKPDVSQVSVGSLYAVYAPTAPGAAIVTPLARGTVALVDSDKAVIALDEPLPTPSLDGAPAIVRELAHDYGLHLQTPALVPTAVLGGQPVKNGDAPWMAELQYRPPFRLGFRPTLLKLHACGGALIDYVWVVTAAHCVPKTAAGQPDADGTPSRLIVRVGSVDLSQGMSTIPIDRVYVHPRFCDADVKVARGAAAPHCAITINDIALFHLSRAAPDAFGGRPPMALLPDILDEAPAQTPVNVMGWGAASDALADRGVMQPMLQVAALRVTSATTCQAANAPFNRVGFSTALPPSLLCAAAPRYSRDACKGDSGGPLLRGEYDMFSTPTVIGVVSFGAACAHAPTIYTRVSQYRGWINTIYETNLPP